MHYLHRVCPHSGWNVSDLGISSAIGLHRIYKSLPAACEQPVRQAKKAFKLPVPGSLIFTVSGRHFSTYDDASVYNYELTMRSSVGAFDRYRLTAWHQWVLLMTKDIKNIHSYYSPKDLYSRIIDGLNEIGKELSEITLEDLHPVDEFHIRGTVATKELIQLSDFTSDMHILDVGCGVGGSARRLSHETGCRVTGVDLSDEYIDVAQRLTRLVDMQERVKFHAASALDLPFEENSFDGVWSIQMSMNVEDKLSWLKELHRVVKPKGRVVLYEVCANKNTPVYFPVPWAQDSSISFLVEPDLFREALTAAGFEVDVWRDMTDSAQQAFANMTEPVGDPELPKLGVHLLVGNDILTKAYNLHRNLDEERVSLIETVVVKP